MTYKPQTHRYQLPGPTGEPSGVEIALEMDSDGLVWFRGDVQWHVGTSKKGGAELIALGFDLTPIEPETKDMGLATLVEGE